MQYIKRLQNEIRNPSGFSLLEITMALGIGTVGIMAVASMFNFQQKATKSLNADLDFGNFRNQVLGVINGNCKTALIEDSGSANVVKLGDLSTLPKNTPVHHIQAPFGAINNQLNGQTITLNLKTTVVDGTAPNYRADLILTSTRGETTSVGGQTKTHTIPLKITTDGTGNNQIIDCSTTETGSRLPAGTSGQTLRHDGSQWVATSSIHNDGTNVGIGTSTPGAHLELAKEATQATFRLTTASNLHSSRLVIARARGTLAAPTAVSGNELGSILFSGHDGTAIEFGPTIGAYATEAWTPAKHGSKLMFFTRKNGGIDGGVALMLDHDGRVGFPDTGNGSAHVTVGAGMSNKGSLQLIGGGDGYLPPELSFWDSKTGGHTYKIAAGHPVAGTFSIRDETSAIDRLTMNGSGLVEINADGAPAKLNLRTSAANWASSLVLTRTRGNMATPTAVVNGNPLGHIFFAGHDGTNSQLSSSIYSYATENWAPGRIGSNIVFYTRQNGTDAGIQRFRIEHDGKIGFPMADTALVTVGGTQAPNTTLQIIGGGDGYPTPELSLRDQQTGGRIYSLFAGRPAGGDFAIRDMTAGANRLTIRNSGFVGIGVDNPGYKFQVGAAGDGSEARANIWNTLSDERLKRDFSSIPDALERLDQLNGYYYYWNRGTDTGRKVGLKAGEVEKVFPEAVSKGNDGFKSLSYGHLIAPVIEAIKTLNRTVSGQGRQLASIAEREAAKDAEITRLKEENAAIRSYLCEKDPQATFCN